jgi:hypothetical protein
MSTVLEEKEGGVEEINNTEENNIDTVLMSFVSLLEQFIAQLHTVFPECAKVQVLHAAFEAHFTEDRSTEDRRQTAVNYIQGWHEDFSNFYTQVSSEDESVFTVNTSFFETTDLLAKWTPSLHIDTKASIWEFVKNLCNLSNMYNIYNQVPSNMMTTIQNKAMSIAQTLENGGSLRNINIQDLAVDIMKEVDMNELQAFANSITNGGTDISKIQVMCGSLMSMLGTQGLDMRQMFQQLN